MSNVRASIGAGLMLGLALSLLMWVTASPAQAETVGKCQAEIAQVRVLLTDTTNPNYADSFTNEKDRTGLIGKLDSASAKLGQGKFQDALANLQSFRTKVVALDQQGKIADEDASTLIAGADEAIACVQGLIDAQATSTA